MDERADAGNSAVLRDGGTGYFERLSICQGPNSLSPLLVIPVAKSDEEIITRKATAAK
jgi:hypothetical protein